MLRPNCGEGAWTATQTTCRVEWFDGRDRALGMRCFLPSSAITVHSLVLIARVN